MDAAPEYPHLSHLVARLQLVSRVSLVAVIDRGKQVWAHAGGLDRLREGKLLQALWLRAAVAVRQFPLRALGTAERVPIGGGQVAPSLDSRCAG
jgi:hypothetical protein